MPDNGVISETAPVNKDCRAFAKCMSIEKQIGKLFNLLLRWQPDHALRQSGVQFVHSRLGHASVVDF